MEMAPASGAGPPRSRDWRRAWRALRRLVEDPTRTEQVFEIIDALAGPADGAVARRFRRDPAAAPLLRERPDLLATLSDRAALSALPPGSLGRAYADFMSAGGLSPAGLVDADLGRPGRSDAGDPDDAWIGSRLRDAHDLWHVVTGYGMDEAGEAALLAFTHAQVGNLGIALIVVTAALLGPRDLRLVWQRYLVRAWWRGRRARWLAVTPWEGWLERPLARVRRDLRIEPPERAHPGGILVATAQRTLAVERG
jgi:ubiquinone biosynthesis protein COQ4